MAAFALFAHFSLMDIVPLVAAVTAGWCLAVWLLIFVAESACGGGVGPLELEVALVVVEAGAVEVDDGGPPPSMVGVAGFALHLHHLWLYLRTETVVAATARDVGGDIIMAVETELALAIFVKIVVTLLALLLVFGVASDDIAGHQQPLEADCIE